MKVRRLISLIINQHLCSTFQMRIIIGAAILIIVVIIIVSIVKATQHWDLSDMIPIDLFCYFLSCCIYASNPSMLTSDWKFENLFWFTPRNVRTILQFIPCRLVLWRLCLPCVLFKSWYAFVWIINVDPTWIWAAWKLQMIHSIHGTRNGRYGHLESFSWAFSGTFHLLLRHLGPRGNGLARSLR